MRMRQVNPAAEDKLELMMTPMIDVVFQLLIFFVCTMKFAAMEGNLPAFLPKKEKATGASAQQQKPADQQELEDITVGLEMKEGKLEISVGQAILPNFRQLAFKLGRLHK
ncbi:MAG: hypothetical protein FJ278_17645, partial [Planctomycetes bacterium]|nr:hypothetical protein [Planctomycetota bacterium]